MTWYAFFKGLLGTAARAVARVEVSGREHLPSEGPFILLANHQSLLDPILVQSACPRPVHSMTKSTQFGHPLMGWVLPRINAFPTRRYQVDSQAVRVVLRRLEAGEPVGIYPEGERSWDGRIQPLRRGTVRVILKAGVPVVPCGVSGSYGVWPRWSRRLRRRRVRLRFGEPLHFGAHDEREEREAALPGAIRRLEEVLRVLSEPAGAGTGGGEEPAPPEGAAQGTDGRGAA